MILQEAAHYLSKLKRGRSGGMIVKIDLEKAYDRLEWDCVRNLLTMFSFTPNWIRQIMSCLSSLLTSVLFNGSEVEDILPTRGIRQGDSMSSYIFILCLEILGWLIEEKCELRKWNSLKIGRGGLEISRLFFADDLILMGKANDKTCVAMMDVLETFCCFSGQKVNKTKSKILFSPNVDVDQKRRIVNRLDIRETNNLGKYLGVPIGPGKPKKEDYNFLVEKVRTKMAGWKANLLSQMGRNVLIQSVTATIPSYYMQPKSLPTRINSELDKINRDCLWVGVVGG